MNLIHCKHTVIVVGIIMALALIGLPFIKLVYTCTVCIVGVALMYSIFLFFARVVDTVIDYLYTEK